MRSDVEDVAPAVPVMAQRYQPFGLIVADKIVEDTTTNSHGIRKNTTVATGTAFIASIYLKAGGRNFAVIYTTGPTGRGRFISIPADGTGTVLGNVTATDAVVTLQYVGNGWYRATIEVNSGTGFGAPIEVYPAISGTNANYLGDGVSGVFVWGAQVEAGAFATSYIPSTSGTATRSADVCSIIGTDFSSFYNQSEGTISKQVYAANGLGSTTQFPFGFSDGTTANQLSIFRATDDPRKFGFFSNTNNVGTPTSPIRTDIINDREYGALAWAFKQNDMGGVFKGQLYTDTTITIPSVNQLHIGNRFDGARPWNGHIARIQYFRKRLSNAKLQTITTP